MSEEKIDVKKLTLSKAIDLFLEGKIPKKDLEDAIDKRDLFKLSNKRLEDVLYAQRKNPSMFPKELRIKSSDIVYEYGRTLNASQLMNLAKEGYITEEDLLKALKKSEVMKVLAVVAEKEESVDKEQEETKDDEKEIDTTADNILIEELKPVETDLESEPEKASSEERTFTQGDILQKEDVARFFTGDRLVKMFFAKKMTREFVEAYDSALKKDDEYTSSTSKAIIKELKEIFRDNLQALFIVIMRLHFRGMILSQDVQETIKSEFFREKTFEPSDTYEVLDKNGNVIYSYKKVDKRVTEEIEPRNDIPTTLITREIPELESTGETITQDDNENDIDDNSVTESYPVLEPITRDEVIDAYQASVIDNDIVKQIFPITELVQMYKNQKISAKVFSLVDKAKRKSEIIKAYENGYMHLEEIMDLFFYHDVITAKELKSIIKDIPKRVAIVRFITVATTFQKIFELYKNKLIDFNILCTLRDQGYISVEQFEEIRSVVNKESFYESIESKTFYTRKTVEPTVIEQPIIEQPVTEQPVIENIESSILKRDDNEEAESATVEISDAENVLLTKVLGVSEDEIQAISIIDSKDENGNPTELDGYQIISDKKDGLVIFGKFDYVSPILVMGYEEAAYFLRSRDDEDETYIYEDLASVDRMENNNQVCIVEHDENMGKTIVQALCELSEVARERYMNDIQYAAEVMEFIKAIDEKHLDFIKETNTNM